MFWNKKKPKSKPQIKTTVPKTFKAKNRRLSGNQLSAKRKEG